MKPESHIYIELAYIMCKRSKKQLFDNSWMLLEDLRVTLSNDEIVIIPSGFRTDLSSIPEFMWGVMKPFGDFVLGAIVHDWMYQTKFKLDELGAKEARKFADKEMFLISSRTNNKHWYNRLDNWLRWKGCRIFGANTYKK